MDLSRYEAIHKLLQAWKQDHGKTVALLNAVQAMHEFPDFVEVLRQDKSVRAEVESVDDLLDRSQRFMYWLLSKREYNECAVLLWGEDVFTPKPHFVHLVWGGLFSESLINVMGGSSTGKTYPAIAWALLDWVLDPEWTQVLLVGPDAKHLERNMFGDLVRLHEASAIKLPGTADSESLSTNKKRAMGFFTVALDRGESESAKLKSTKVKPREGDPHPIFGQDSRVRILIDEAQQVPPNLFKMIVNLVSNMGSAEHFKILMAANPSDEYSLYGKNCVPPQGFEWVKDDTETWRSVTGWYVIRLNAYLCENVVEGRVIFPRLVDRKKISATIDMCGGDDDHPDVWTFVKGMFPPQGALNLLIRNDWIRRQQGEWIFDRDVKNWAALDPALLGGDQPALALGRTGHAIGWTDFEGKKHDLEEPGYRLQVDVVGILPRGDTQEVADATMDRLVDGSVPPERYGQDITGNGIGVFDTIAYQLAKRLKLGDERAPIIGINYSYRPSKIKICAEDTQMPEDLYDRMATEIWYATAKFFEMGYIMLGRGVTSKTLEQLAGRRGGRPGQKGRRQTIESKETYKSRTKMGSPDEADSVTILCQIARSGIDQLLPKAPKTEAEADKPFDIDPWNQSRAEQFTRIKGMEKETHTPDFVTETGIWESGLDDPGRSW